MKRLILPSCLIAVALCGCIETKQEFTINPDGSGKVVDEAIFQPLNLNMTGEEDKSPQSTMKEAVKDELENAEGVDAWKDVSYQLEKDGRVRFKGTAYFKDIAKLHLHNNGFSSDMLRPSLQRDGKDGLVLELKSQKATGEKQLSKAPSTPLTEEELAKKIPEEKAKYQQARPMMAAMVATLKMDLTFHLPGQVAQSTNFKKDEQGNLRVTMEGQKLLEVMDARVKDDSWWRQEVVAGHSFVKDGPTMDDEVNEKIYGEKGPIRAVVRGDLKTLFDYTAEVAAAKQNYPKMVKSLALESYGPAAVTVTATAKGEGFKSLTVGGVRLVSMTDKKREIRPFNWDEGYTLSLVGELPGAILNATGGKVEKAVADNGDDLLPKREWDRKISFPSVSKDKTAVIFEVKLAVPGPEVKGIKELSGTFEYNVGSSTKETDLGITDFSAGTHGTECGAEIKSTGPSKYSKGKNELQLYLRVPKDSIKTVTFYGADGSKLDLSSSGSFFSDRDITFTYITTNSIPPKGKIVAEVYEQLQKYEVPFVITNISLLGQPLK